MSTTNREQGLAGLITPALRAILEKAIASHEQQAEAHAEEARSIRREIARCDRAALRDRQP